jgi:hypothetical protein
VCGGVIEDKEEERVENADTFGAEEHVNTTPQMAMIIGFIDIRLFLKKKHVFLLQKTIDDCVFVWLRFFLLV